MREIERIFVHCTAGWQTQTAMDIVKFHTGKNGLGWKTPGYHYIVEPDGFVVNAVPIEKISNGVKGYNATAINIAYIGGLAAGGKAVDNRTPAQKAALTTLLKDLRAKFPKAVILGHRDISPDINGNGTVDPWERIKECPCFDAIEEYKDI